MSAIKRAISKTVYHGAGALKSAFNIVSGQWMLNNLTHSDKRRMGDNFNDPNGIKIYNQETREVAHILSAAIGGTLGLMIGFFTGLETESAMTGLSVGMAILAGAYLATTNGHALVSTLSYNLRTLYNEGAQHIQEEQRQAEEIAAIEANDNMPEEPETRQADTNGPINNLSF